MIVVVLITHFQFNQFMIVVVLITHFQFNQFMIVVEEMLYKVVTEQRAHLEQLAAMEQQTE